MHTGPALGLTNASRELEGQGQAPAIQQGQSVDSSATTEACPGCKNVGHGACACQPCPQCKKLIRPSNMRRVKGILHCRRCQASSKSTTPLGNACTPTTSTVEREFVLFRTLNFDNDTKSCKMNMLAEEGADPGAPGVGSVVSVLAKTVAGLQVRFPLRGCVARVLPTCLSAMSMLPLSPSLSPDFVSRCPVPRYTRMLLRTGHDGRCIPAHGRVAAAEPADDAANERCVLACPACARDFTCVLIFLPFELSWADCMEHYMQAGLVMKLVPVPRGRGELLPGEAGDTTQSVGCVVKIVLKDTIKFPIANAVLTLTCGRSCECGSRAPTDSELGAQGREELVPFRVTEHM